MVGQKTAECFETIIHPGRPEHRPEGGLVRGDNGNAEFSLEACNEGQRREIGAGDQQRITAGYKGGAGMVRNRQ